MAQHDETQDPLLEDLEGQNVWGNPPRLEDIEDEVTNQCSVTSLLERRQAHVLRFLQAKGVSLLGEFEEEDSVVFPCFEENQLLTFGSDRRKLDYEAEWRRRLHEANGRHARKTGWSNKVAVEAYVVTIRDAAAPDRQGLLQPLLKRYQAKRCSYAVFALPAVQAVIKFKWKTYARRLLLLELLCFLLWLVAFNVFTIAFQDEDLSQSLGQLLKSTRGRVTVAAEILALVGMAPFLLLEVGTIPAYGLAWLDVWNSLDLLTYATQIGVTVCHLGRFWTKSELLSALLALQSILLVFRLQWFTQAFQGVRISYLPIMKEVWATLRPAYYLMLLSMWGFACAFNIALRRDQEDQEEYSHIVTSFLSMFEHQYGDIEMKPMWKSKSPKIATALAVAYTFVQGTIIINVLLGIVISALDKATENEGMKVLLNQARIIDEIESLLPSWLERRCPGWFPAYVHMLRINPDKLDRVEQDALWTMMGRDEPQVLGTAGSSPLTDSHPRHIDSMGGEEGGEGGDGDEGGGGKGAPAPGGDSLQASVAALQRQLDEQGRMLRSLCASLAAAPTDSATS